MSPAWCPIPASQVAAPSRWAAWFLVGNNNAPAPEGTDAQTLSRPAQSGDQRPDYRRPRGPGLGTTWMLTYARLFLLGLAVAAVTAGLYMVGGLGRSLPQW